MAKIRHGKYVYTPEQAERALEDKDLEAATLKMQLDVAEAWVSKVLSLHQPSPHQVDLSIQSYAEMKEQFLHRVGMNLFCIECGTAWPCPQIAALRTLRQIVRPGADLEGARGKIKNMKVRDDRPVIKTVM